MEIKLFSIGTLYVLQRLLYSIFTFIAPNKFQIVVKSMEFLRMFTGYNSTFNCRQNIMYLMLESVAGAALKQ